MTKKRFPSNRWAVLFALAGILFLSSLACSSLTSPTATPTARPTRTAASTKTAAPVIEPTSEPVEEPTATPSMDVNDWQPILLDSFDNNDSEWFVGKYEGEYIIETVSIENGKYLWNTQAKDYVEDFGIPNVGSLGDFHLSVEGLLVNGPEYAEYGLIFRSDESSDYSFGIDQQSGEFYLCLDTEDNCTLLIDYTESSAIHTGGSNQLAVTAVGSHFDLYINGELVGQVDDSSLPFGEVGVFIYLDQAGDTANFEFDNFEVYSP